MKGLVGFQPKALQLPLFEIPSDWSPPSLGDLPSWADAKRVGIDTETNDRFLKQLGPGVRRGAYICGISFAIEDGPKYYVPIRHEGGDNVDVEGALRYFRDQAKVFKGDLVGANLQYDLDFLAEEGIWFEHVRYFRDIQIADPLINELHLSYSLQNIANRQGLPGKDETKLREAAVAYGIDAKSGMWRLPARYVGRYAEQDAYEPLAILRRQEREIDEQDLWNVYNLESQVLPVLVKMRRRGVKIDQDRLSGIETWSIDQEFEALAKVKHLTGVSIAVGDVWKADAFAPALEAIGVRLEKTSTGKPSIRKDVLTSINHPVADALLWARKVNKLRTTFAQSIRTHLTNGRIHCTFNQIAVDDGSGDEDGNGGGIKGARYGRLSCANPNLQQQPSRDEFAARWRSIYIPDTDLWACMDYSQQEPRWTTHYAEVMNLPRAFEAAQRYRDDPDTDNHDMMTRIVFGDAAVDAMNKAEFKSARSTCKIIYLGLCYGEGGAKLCRDLNLPTRWAVVPGTAGGYSQIQYFENQREAQVAARDIPNPRIYEAAGLEGQEILDKFNGNAPFIKKLAKAAETRAKKHGVIVTAGGRKCHFATDAQGNFEYTHKALNRLIQGSSADQTKTAMVELDAAGYDLQLQVHDEIDMSVINRQQAEDAAVIMRECMKSGVPFKVDVEVGPSWGEIQ